MVEGFDEPDVGMNPIGQDSIVNVDQAISLLIHELRVSTLRECLRRDVGTRRPQRDSTFQV